MSSTANTILGALIAKGHINSDFIGNVSATQDTASTWTINSDLIWEGDPGLGNPSYEFESLPYSVTVTHGSSSAGGTLSVTITDAAIGAFNGGNDTITVSTPNETSTSTITVAGALKTAINNNTILHDAGYTATSAGAKVTIQPGPGDDPTSVTSAATGVITDTLAPPSTTDANGNSFDQVAVAQVGAGGVGSFVNYDILSWNSGNLLLGFPDGAGGYQQFLQLSDTNLNPSGNPPYPVTVDQTGTFVVPCFVAGTRIATPSGEVAVERLRIGDMVLTPSGAAKPVKWLGWRTYGARAVAASAAAQPVRIRAGALAANTPRCDLFVSPQHAMLIDGMLLPAAALVNDISITRCRDYGDVTYIHIELDDHDAVLAEGAAAETFVDCGSRAMFHNAAEYAALYSNETPRDPCFCAPRIEAGEELEAVCQRIEARAGSLRIAAAAPGPMQGHVERVAHDAGELHIEGWVLDTANRRRAVRLEVLVDGEVVGKIVANRYRADLEAAGLAGGRCAFDLTVRATAGAVVVRRVCDGAVLPIAGQAAGFAQAA
jgi:hypothetical protein